MTYQLVVNDIVAAVTRKAIKNLHLAICPPNGDVCISAPLWMDDKQIRQFMLLKMPWIKKHKAAFLARPVKKIPEFKNMETHYVWAQPYLLSIHPDADRDEISLENNILNVFLRGDASRNRISAIFETWHKQLVAEEGARRIEHWRNVFNLPPVTLHVRKMKTRWGSCSPWKNAIRLNAELAIKPRKCLNYVVAHELAHFFVPNHGKDFIRFMDKHLPDWKIVRQLLNTR